MPWQLRERRPFETRKDYIREALDSAKGHGWQTFEEMAALAGRMLDENPKIRISLPEAAAAAASSILLLSRQQQASAASNGAAQTGLADRAVTGAQATQAACACARPRGYNLSIGTRGPLGRSLEPRHILLYCATMARERG